jgi:hypothetical protein
MVQLHSAFKPIIAPFSTNGTLFFFAFLPSRSLSPSMSLCARPFFWPVRPNGLSAAQSRVCHPLPLYDLANYCSTLPPLRPGRLCARVLGGGLGWFGRWLWLLLHTLTKSSLLRSPSSLTTDATTSHRRLASGPHTAKSQTPAISAYRSAPFAFMPCRSR